MAPQKPYPTDLTDKEWALIAPYVPAAKPGGRPEKYPKREILDTIFYILRGGIVNLLTLLLSCTLVRLRHPYTGPGRSSISIFGAGATLGRGS